MYLYGASGHAKVIIDIHSHIKLDGQQPLFQDMDKNGIDYRIVSCLSEPDTKIANKFVEAEELVDSFTSDVKTHTAAGKFDQYIEQCYLDNFLRGGYPYVLNKDGNKSIIHLFSRKHGDPERDYNFFSIAAEYYSQGNGNFRDVSQNRRNDVFFNKDVGEFNVKTFFSLIQADGYNPLEVRPSLFNIKEGKEDEVKAYVADSISGDATAIQNIVAGKFTPGQISNTIAKLQLELKVDDGDFIANILNDCDQNIEAGFAEGYWSDHWDYNMDLVDNYLSIFPDKLDELVFKDNTYKFYDSVAYVVPRSEKYVINKKGAVRQYGMEVEDEAKLARPGFNKWATNWLKTPDEKIYNTTLAVKMITLALSKFAQLDVDGMGVEMEGGKPGWNDAMNGLPGLFGSGTPETFELKRLIKFITDNFNGSETVVMPAEIAKYLDDVKAVLDKYNNGQVSDFEYWDEVATIRENYRESVKLYLSGEETEVSKDYINEVFSAFAAKIDKGIEKAVEMGNGLVPTYFTHEAVDFEPVVDENGNPVMSHYGLQKAVVKEFKTVALPYFLEGPARMLEGVLQGREDSAELRRLRGEGELVETLTREIANEYRKRAMLLPANGLQDIGKRRELRKELQTRCDLTELQAVNIINGFHIPDYVKIAAIKAEKEAQENEN